MDAAFAWVGQFIEWFGQFFPRRVIVPLTHRAVKFVGGSRAVACGPGPVWYWPVQTKFDEHPVVRQSVNLKSQTIMTADEKSILVGGMVVYVVEDIVKLLANTWNGDETVRDVTLGAIHDVCSQLSWPELRTQMKDGKLDRDLRRETKKVLDTYGVRVLRMTLTDLAPVRVLKLVQATTTD